MSAIAAKVFSGLMNARIAAPEEDAEDREQPPQPLRQHRQRELLNRGPEKHEADDDPDGRHRGLVELKDHNGDHDPADPEDEPEPPVPERALIASRS